MRFHRHRLPDRPTEGPCHQSMSRAKSTPFYEQAKQGSLLKQELLLLLQKSAFLLTQPFEQVNQLAIVGQKTSLFLTVPAL